MTFWRRWWRTVTHPHTLAESPIMSGPRPDTRTQAEAEAQREHLRQRLLHAEASLLRHTQKEEPE